MRGIHLLTYSTLGIIDPVRSKKTGKGGHENDTASVWEKRHVSSVPRVILGIKSSAFPPTRHFCSKFAYFSRFLNKPQVISQKLDG